MIYGSIGGKGGIAMDLGQLSRILYDLANSKGGEIFYQDFFVLMHRLSLIGMGCSDAAGTAHSGERCALQYARQALPPDHAPVVFDVGANTGAFAALANTIFPDATVYCFEPAAATFEMLRETLARVDNPAITAFNLALGDAAGEGALYSNRAGSALASLYPRRLEHLGGALDQQETVSVATIDGFCADHDIRHIDYLKLDVEGNELKCLKGASRMISAGAVDFIQFEFGGTMIDSRDFFQDFWYFLKDYKIMRILKDGLYHIREYSEQIEIFTMQNFLAQRKS